VGWLFEKCVRHTKTSAWCPGRRLQFPQSCGAGAREFRSHRKEKGVTRTPLFTSIFIHTPEKARLRKISVGGRERGAHTKGDWNPSVTV